MDQDITVQEQKQVNFENRNDGAEGDGKIQGTEEERNMNIIGQEEEEKQKEEVKEGINDNTLYSKDFQQYEKSRQKIEDEKQGTSDDVAEQYHKLVVLQKQMKQSLQKVKSKNTDKNNQPSKMNEEIPQPEQISTKEIYKEKRPDFSSNSQFDNQLTEKQQSSNFTKSSRMLKKKRKYRQIQTEVVVQSEDQQSSQIQARVASFKNPIQQQTKAQPKTQIDFIALKRSQEELGLTNINIMEMLTPSSNRLQKQKQKQKQKLAEKVLQSDKKQEVLRSQPVQISNTQEDPQQQQNLFTLSPKKFNDCGVGTYSQLQSRITTPQKSMNNFKALSSTKNSLHQQRPKLSSKLQQKRNSLYMSRSQPKPNPQHEQSHPKTTEKDRQKQLKSQSKVIQIQVNQLAEQSNESMVPQLLKPITNKRNPTKKDRRWQSCNNTPIRQQSADLRSFTDSIIDHSLFNLVITNLSLNFHRNIFGSKSLQIISQDHQYATQELKGNNLIWIGKHYQFIQMEQNQQIIVNVLSEDTLLGRVKISLTELLMNQKQNYYQSLILSELEVIGNIVIGFSLQKLKLQPKLFQEGSSNSQTELKKKKTSKKQTPRYQALNGSRLPQPRTSVIKQRKYKGGHNIKIGRAHRFDTQYHKQHPGPGNYEIESTFSRHAIKQS